MFDKLFDRWAKASRCKELMESVQGRLKLLKSKRSCIVKQQREDVAELLNLGHRERALRRVDEIVRGENMIQVYDMLHNVCEFLIVNLPYMRKTRDCPSDIKEAVSTLIYSSSRFGELPELLFIRKLFGERYSEELVTNALELLPGSSVSTQIKQSLELETVADDVRCKILDEIVRSCINENVKAPMINGQEQRVFTFKLLVEEQRRSYIYI